MKKIVNLSALGFLVLSVSACSSHKWVSLPQYETAEASAPVAQETAASRGTFNHKKRAANEVAPGYLISIKSSDPKLNGSFRVDFDYSVKLPYNVRLNAAGMNEDQLTSAIRDSYKSYFRSTADISVSIAKKEYLVDVQGLVMKPGQYPLSDDSTLDEVIAAAGGLNLVAGPDTTAQYAKVTSSAGTAYVRIADYHSGISNPKIVWQGGETVFFQTQAGPLAASGAPSRNSVRILGQVKNPAEYTVEKNADFFTYLVKAGGPTERADLSNIFVVRWQNKETKTLTFNMFDTDEIPQILPGDAIIVNSDVASSLEKKTRIGANISGIISALGLVAIAAGN